MRVGERNGLGDGATLAAANKATASWSSCQQASGDGILSGGGGGCAGGGGGGGASGKEVVASGAQSAGDGSIGPSVLNCAIATPAPLNS